MEKVFKQIRIYFRRMISRAVKYQFIVATTLFGAIVIVSGSHAKATTSGDSNDEDYAAVFTAIVATAGAIGGGIIGAH